MSMLSSRIRAHSPAYAGLAILFLISCTEWVRNTADDIDEIMHGEEFVRAPFLADVFTSAVTYPDPTAEAAGLQKGDTVVAIGGRPFEGLSDLAGAVRRARLGDRLPVRVRSVTAAGPVEKELSIELPRFNWEGLTKGVSSAYPWVILLNILIPLFCIVLGFWVAFVRVGDRAAWLLLLLMLSFAYEFGSDRTAYGNEDALQPFLTALSWGFVKSTSLALASFGIVFPERLPFDRRFPWVKWLIFGPILIWVAVSAVFGCLVLHHLARAQAMLPVFQPLNQVGEVYLNPAALASFFVVLIFKTVKAQSRDARRRLLLLDAGAAIGILPFATTLLPLPAATGYFGWRTIVGEATLLIFPLTMAYVIVVHRAMDVSVVIRQGLQYLLATGSIRVLQVAISIAIIMAATMSADTSVPRRIVLISIGFALLAGIRGFARRLQRWIDRRFFREAYEADAILSELAIKVRTIVEIGPLLETVAGRIAASLHVPNIVILLNEGGAFRPAYALGYPAPPVASIGEESLTLRRLRRQQHAIVAFDEADSWVQLTADDERASLKQLRSELLLPLSLNDKMLGIMSLGQKQSEEPFSAGDIRLLDSVAAQTGLALEHGRLTEAIKTEVATREKHKRELEIAHEVQERLFPQIYPPVPGLEYAGACRPALGVGGDYYDFILLSKTELGIAIGDVSGKGIPAALLMATLRAFLRGQTAHHLNDLTAVMANLNKLVYESSAPNRYATFFYAEFDSGTRLLRYVNAGHNPPMVFRTTGDVRDVLRLDNGGTVVGLMENCSYAQGCVTLETGDVIVAFTDGISEALDVSDEEWGEDRMIDVVWPNRAAPAEEIIRRVMMAADTFVAGAPQYDDMTLVVVRVI
jgi:sigma-B regulation protein RsbU (phosphoserine phosphatase)